MLPFAAETARNENGTLIALFVLRTTRLPL
jgi:hypothetical protein